MKVKFHFNNSEFTVKIKDNKKVIDLKHKMIQLINDNKIKYIDLNFICENPIRSFGQQTINNGIFSRTWDNMTLNNYPMESNNLKIEVILVYDHNHNKHENSRRNPIRNFTFNKRENKTKQQKPKIKPLKFDYDIDFPPLGS